MSRRRRRPSARAAGLTLAELAAILAVLGLMIVVVLPVLARAGSENRKTACAATLAAALKGLQQYAADHNGVFPTRGFGPRTARFDVIGWKVDREVRRAKSLSLIHI